MSAQKPSQIDLFTLQGNANMGLLYNKYFGFSLGEVVGKNAVYDPTKSKSAFFRLYEKQGNKQVATIGNERDKSRKGKRGEDVDEKAILLTMLTTQHATQCPINKTGYATLGHKERGSNLALKNAIDQTHARRHRMLQGMGFSENEVTRQYRSDGFFLTGVGLPHPIGNNLQFHSTLGTPYLPGSAVKGALKHYIREMMKMGDGDVEVGAEENTGQNEIHPEDLNFIEHLFGLDEELRKVVGGSEEKAHKEKNKNEGGKSGNYIFFDALPVGVPEYTTDVMTPHYADWYVKGGEEKHTRSNTPNDWSDPVPIQFLVVDNIKLEFAILPKNPASKDSDEREKQEQELSFLFTMLQQLVEFRGLGAKTCSGFGYFK